MSLQVRTLCVHLGTACATGNKRPVRPARPAAAKEQEDQRVSQKGIIIITNIAIVAASRDQRLYPRLSKGKRLCAAAAAAITGVGRAKAIEEMLVCSRITHSYTHAAMTQAAYRMKMQPILLLSSPLCSLIPRPSLLYEAHNHTHTC